MSLVLIQESAKEVRRLAIAGSPLAVGDFRLKKLVAPLEQAGAKVPVFAQVAKAISDLVNGQEADSAANLLNLSTLLNAILYTQGQSGADGDYRELEAFATNCSSTRTSARLLKPLVQALTTTGGGRFEIIKSACDRGACNDLRLIDPAIQALGDIYPELADLAAKKILPAYGPGIVSRLKATLDLKGKKPDARKLVLMHQLEPAGTLALCKTALEEGSVEVKTAAITCLGKHEDCLALVLEQTKSKNKVVREAALEALAVHDHPDVTAVFTKMILGKAADLVPGSLRLVRNHQVFALLLSEARDALGKAFKSEASSIVRFIQLLECLQVRKDTQTEEFLVACIAQSDKLGKVKATKECVFGGADIIRDLAKLLYAVGSPQSLNAILAHRDKISSDSFPLIVESAFRVWSADKVYQEFAPLLELKKGADKHKGDEVEIAIIKSQSMEISTSRRIELDARWLDAAITADREQIVLCLAKPGHKAAVAYILKLLDTENRLSGGFASLFIETLVRCQYPKVTEVFLRLVAKKTKGTPMLDWHMQQLFESARHLPAADLPKLDAFAAKLDEKFVDKYLEALAPLRSAPPTN